MKAKRKFSKILMLLTLGSFLMAFTKSSEENKGNAKLIFLHERAFWGAKVEVRINKQRVIDLPNNKYFEIEVNEGNTEIIIDRHNNLSRKGEPDVQASLMIESGKIYYLKIYREVDYFTDRLYLVRISEQTAKQVMKSMKLEKNPLGNE